MKIHSLFTHHIILTLLHLWFCHLQLLNCLCHYHLSLLTQIPSPLLNSPLHSPLTTSNSPISSPLPVNSTLLHQLDIILENTAPPFNPLSPTLRKSTRTHKPPSYLQEFHCNNASSVPAPSHCSPTTNQGTAPTDFPLSNYISYSHLAPCYHSFVLNAFAI
jgi:hypothetical protein